MPVSYNGWTASKYPASIGIVHFEPIPGYDFPAGVKGGDVKVIFTYLVQQLNARVERISHYAPGDEWGYHYKYSANTPSKLSNHSSGTAIDYNATRHPNGVRGTWSSAQVAEIRKILNELSGVVRWLYDATRVPDEMHFEIRGTASQVKAVADRLRNKPEEPFTVAQYDEIIRKLDNIAGAVLTSVAEGRELDDDIPENLATEVDLVRIAVRNIGAGLNSLLQKEGLPPVDIGDV